MQSPTEIIDEIAREQVGDDIDRAWSAFDNWLIMNVGSVEAEQAKELVTAIVNAYLKANA